MCEEVSSSVQLSNATFTKPVFKGVLDGNCFGTDRSLPSCSKAYRNRESRRREGERRKGGREEGELREALALTRMHARARERERGIGPLNIGGGALSIFPSREEGGGIESRAGSQHISN